MSKPIIENNTIHFDGLLNLIKKNLRGTLRHYLIISIIFIIYFFVKTPEYSAKLSFYTNYTPSQQMGISLSFLPQSLGGLTSDGLNFSVSDYISSKKFLQEIVEEKYVINSQETTLIDFWGKNYKNFFTANPIQLITRLNNNIMLNQSLSENEKKSYFARSKLKSSINFSEDRITVLNSITVTTKKHPDLSVHILNNIYESILDYYKEINNTKAFEKKSFITERLKEIKDELKKSEENMILFLEKNKESNSPTLILKKESLQREINLYSQLYVSLSDQLELAKIDEKDNTSSIFLLDAPNVSSNKDCISLLKGFIYIFILLFLFSMAFHMYNDRKKLFLQ